MYHRDTPQKISRQPGTTTLRLLYGGILGRNERTADQTESIDQIGVRYILGVRRDAHITPYWKRLGWLRSDSRILYYTALLLYKIRRMREPTYLADFFKEHNRWPTSRGIQPALTRPAVSYETGEGSFQVQGARLWNSLPPPFAIFHHMTHLRGRCGNISSIGTPNPIKTSRYWPLASLGKSWEIWLTVNVEGNKVQWLWYYTVFKKEDWYLFYFIFIFILFYLILFYLFYIVTHNIRLGLKLSENWLWYICEFWIWLWYFYISDSCNWNWLRYFYISILFLPNVFNFESHNGLVLVHDRTFKTE